MANDRTEAHVTSLEAIRRYLQLHRWTESGTKSDAVSLFTLIVDGTRLELPLPIRHDFDGAKRFIADALRTLSQLDNRDVFEIIEDINSIGFDRVRSIIPDALVRSETIDLNIATNFVIGARRLVTATATNELTPSPFYGRATKEAQAYTDRCRFGHTFRGSFGFTIESPLVQNDEPAFPGVTQTPPFERRVVQRIVRGLHDVRQAEASDNPGVIAEHYQTGFNANMCEAFADLIAGTTDQLRIEVAWSPEWTPTPDVQPDPIFQIRPSTLEIVREAATSLRKAETAKERSIVGPITRLKSEHNPADLLDISSPREIVVQWNSSEFGVLNVRTTLSPADYLTALEAHKSGRMIAITGMLERINRTWILSFPRDVGMSAT